MGATNGVIGWVSAKYLAVYGDDVATQLPSQAVLTTKCARDPDDCTADARSKCGGSYAVIDSRSYAGGLISDALPGPVTWYALTFQCGPSNGVRGHFPFEGPDPTISLPTYDGGNIFGSDDTVAPNDMQRYCVGEASAYFGERPQNFSTLPVERSGGEYIVYGQFPPDGFNVTTFQCYFDASGQFLSVQ